MDNQNTSILEGLKTIDSRLNGNGYSGCDVLATIDSRMQVTGIVQIVLLLLILWRIW